jgi:hypothetical protein
MTSEQYPVYTRIQDVVSPPPTQQDQPHYVVLDLAFGEYGVIMMSLNKIVWG